MSVFILEIIFPSETWLIKAFTLPTIEAKEVELLIIPGQARSGQVRQVDESRPLITLNFGL